MSKVAIWMPVYNEEAHLRAALDSVLEQTLPFPDFTIYVSDNHSTDSTPQILEEYGADILRWCPKAHLAGISHMKFCWEKIPKGHIYSIQIGGHDKWPKHHLETLVKRMDLEISTRLPTGQRVALCYPDTFQVNEAGNTVGRYQDILQIGQISPMMIPQYVIAGVNSPHVFGLWNEAIRRKVPFRHPCSGWDHLVIAEAALHGMILFEGSTGLVMRCPKAGDCTLERYGERHLSAEQRAAGTKDFYDQLDWLVHCVDMALETVPAPARPLYKALATNSMFSTYVMHRGLNLNICPGAMAKFNGTPEVQAMFAGAAQADKLLRELIGLSQMAPKPIAKGPRAVT